ncbi:MAG: C39 family peptidase [Deltaproteobacteria bacterium]|jgi:hypothetical protein|nr:C39 family peptidase [Deltaproteobacteria bacterium]
MAIYRALPAAFAAVILLAGCAPFLSGQAGGFEVPSDRFLIAGVPFIPDDSSHCGPSSLAAVMSFHGRPTTKEEVAADVQRADLRGSLGPDLVIWARSRGMRASFSSSGPAELVAWLREGKPVILLLETGLGPIHKGHFVVAVGFGPEGLVVNTGEVQQRIAPWPDLIGDWRRMGHFAILVEGRDAQGAAATGDGTGEPAPGSPALDPGPVEVVSPARISQALNLPVGLDLPEGLADARPPAGAALASPAADAQGPRYLTGADIPGARTEAPAPVIDISNHPALAAEGTSEEVEKEEAPAQAASSLGDLLMAPLPAAEPGRQEGVGFSQEDLGTPAYLPVVPLPEEMPPSGSPMGPAFQGPATVPGASVPGRAAGPAQEAPEAQAEREPVMDWER